MRSIHCSLVAAAMLALLPRVASAAPSSDCPMFRSDPAHSGRCADGGARRFSRLVWKFTTHGPIFSTPAVVGGTAYFGSADGALYAVATADGRERWTFRTGARVNASPAVVDGVVYCGSYDGIFYAVDAATGHERWRFRTGGEHRFTATHLHGALPVAEHMPDPFDVFLSSPCVVDGTVYFGSGDGSVYALDAHSGTERWRFATGDVVHASPAVDRGTLYVGSWDSWFYALDAATGRLRWRFKTGEDPNIHNQVGISSSATVAGGAVYFGCRDGHLYALDAATGAKRWAVSTDGAWVTSAPLLRNGEVWFGSGSSHLDLAVDAATGKETWRLALTRGVFASPVDCGPLVLFAGLDGAVTAVDARAHRVAWSWQDPAARRANDAYVAAQLAAQRDTLSSDSRLYDHMVERFSQSLTGCLYGSPVVVGDRLMVGSTDGSLYALAPDSR